MTRPQLLREPRIQELSSTVIEALTQDMDRRGAFPMKGDILCSLTWDDSVGWALWTGKRLPCGNISHGVLMADRVVPS